MKSTKELARKLGLLRKRSTTSQQDRDLRKAGKTCQTFAYLIVIDFESTCWKDRKNVGQEIIEFPAVLLNTSSGEVESEFHTYVLPEENPVLSDFCTEFTGITQGQVESGAPLCVCLSQFSRWLKRLEAEKSIAYNTTQDEDKKLCTFVTWSDWDLAVCLHYECKRKQLVKPPALTSWIDLRATYKNFYQRKPQGLHGALQDVGIEFHGRQHSGLDDSRNTAKLAWRMVCDGCVMKITRTMQRNIPKRPPVTAHKPMPTQAPTQAMPTQAPTQAIPTQAPTQATQRQDSKTTVASSSHTVVKPVIKAPTNKTSYQYQPTTVISHCTYTAHDMEPRNTEDIYIAPESQGYPGCGEDLDSDEFVTATQAIAWQDKWGNMDSNPGPPTSNVMTSTGNALGANARTPQSTFGGFSGNTLGAKSIVSVQTCLGSNLGESTPVGQGDQNASRKGVKRSSPMGDNGCCATKIWQGDNKSVGKPGNLLQTVDRGSAQKQSPPLWTTLRSKNGANAMTGLSGGFKTPIGPAPIARKSPGTNGALKTPPNSSNYSSNSKVLRTPTTNISPQMLGGKVTPPMCGCGRRAKKNNVASPGPNLGRAFYSCPNRKGGRSSESALNDSTNRRKQGCGYFKWESVVMREKLVMYGTPLTYKHMPVSNASTPILGYKHTPGTVGKLGQSYIGVGSGNGGSASKPVGMGRRLGMSQRTVLKAPSMS